MFWISPYLQRIKKRWEKYCAHFFLEAGELGSSEWLDFEIWESQVISDKIFCLFQSPSSNPFKKKNQSTGNNASPD